MSRNDPGAAALGEGYRKGEGAIPEMPLAKRPCRCSFPSRNEFLKLRRWSLGFRLWTGGRTRQG